MPFIHVQTNTAITDEHALELLKALVQTAPEDYRAYREAAFVLYGQEQQKFGILE